MRSTRSSTRDAAGGWLALAAGLIALGIVVRPRRRLRRHRLRGRDHRLAAATAWSGTCSAVGPDGVRTVRDRRSGQPGVRQRGRRRPGRPGRGDRGRGGDPAGRQPGAADPASTPGSPSRSSAGVALVVAVLRAFTRRTAEISRAYQRDPGPHRRRADRIAGRHPDHRRRRHASSARSAGSSRPLPELHRARPADLAGAGPLRRPGRHRRAAGAGRRAGRGRPRAGGAARISAGELFAASSVRRARRRPRQPDRRVRRTGPGTRRRHAARRRCSPSNPVGYGRRALPAGPGRLEFRWVTVRAGDERPARRRRS